MPSMLIVDDDFQLRKPVLTCAQADVLSWADTVLTQAEH